MAQEPNPTALKPCGRDGQMLMIGVRRSTKSHPASRPFDPPQTGKTAVKVINHHGDEVVHVYQI